MMLGECVATITCRGLKACKRSMLSKKSVCQATCKEISGSSGGHHYVTSAFFLENNAFVASFWGNSFFPNQSSHLSGIEHVPKI